MLHASGTLDGLSVAMVAAYCTAWGNYIKAAEELQRHGTTRRALSGRVFVSAYFRVWLRASKDLLRAATTLGLSPASRITR
jgi:P27 family predicted phage terminase small subunit